MIIPVAIYLLVLLVEIASYSRSLSPAVYSCCTYNNADVHVEKERLFDCIGNTTHRSLLPSIRTAVPYLQGKQGPKLSILLVTRATRNLVFEYAAYSTALQSMYAVERGYGYLITTQEYTPNEEYIYFPKLRAILDAWDSEAAHADYIVWMDCGS